VEFTDDELIAQPVGYWTLAARQAVEGHINNRLGEHLGIRQPHWWTLYRVGETEEGLTRDELAERIHYTRPYVDPATTVLPAVQDLLDSGHLTLTDSGRLQLTGPGREMRGQLIELIPRVLGEIHEGVDDKDYATTVRVLRRMIRNVGGNADFH